MVLHLVTYLVLVFAAVTAVWLAARLIGVGRPFSGPTGLAWLDAEDAFNRARKQHRHHLLAAELHRSPHRLDLPDLSDVSRPLLIGQRNPREQLIALRDVVGTADGGTGKFDRDFLPTDDRSRWRFKQIVVAIRKGDPLPPIEVFAHRGHYYVSDGHHRVAAFRAIEETLIAAHVTETLPVPVPVASIGHPALTKARARPSPGHRWLP